MASVVQNDGNATIVLNNGIGIRTEDKEVRITGFPTKVFINGCQVVMTGTVVTLDKKPWWKVW